PRARAARHRRTSSGRASRRRPPARAPWSYQALSLLPADRVILQPLRAQRRGVVEVAAVEDRGGLQRFFEGGEIGAAEFLPLGDDRQRIGALERVERIIDDRDAAAVGKDLARLSPRRRIVGAHAGAGRDQVVDQREARRLAHVVGVGLEREPPDGDALAAQLVVEAVADLEAEHVLLRFVHFLDRAEEAQRLARLLGAALQGFHVLWKARAAEADAGIQELVADARIGADA